MKRYRPKRRMNREAEQAFDGPPRVIRVRDRERGSFSKDLWPADTEFEDAIADLQRAWRQHSSLGGRRSRTERRAWQYLIEVARSLPLHERERQ